MGLDLNSGGLQNVSFTGNMALGQTSAGGGAISALGSMYNLLLLDCHFSNNSAPAASGGAIYFPQLSSALTIQSCSFRFNTAIISGGAIYFGSFQLSYINASNFYFNYLTEQVSDLSYGGSLYLGPQSYRVLLQMTSIEESKALHGGAVYVDDSCSIVQLVDCRITRNEALYGGGIYVAKTSNNVAIMDGATYQGFTSIQTDHPYDSSDGSDGVVVYQQGLYASPNPAIATFVSFTPSTAIAKDDTLQIFNSLGQVVWETTGNSDAWPGFEARPLYIDGNGFYYLFKGPASKVALSSQKYYGFEMLVYPFNDGSDVDYEFKSIFEGNRAASGGALYFYYLNVCALFMYTLFDRNRATTTGGAVSLDLANNGVYFRNCRFVGQDR